MSLCGICSNEVKNKIHLAREMMFGYRDEFHYLECAQCGCLQLVDVPSDLSKYYPADYRAFGKLSITEVEGKQANIGGRLKQLGLSRRNLVDRFYLNKNFLPGRIVERLYGLGTPHDFPYWLLPKQKVSHLNLNFRSSILDVGCGTGRQLLELRAKGFSKLLGIDPFIDGDIDYGNGVKIVKEHVDVLDQEFDFIMLHHSFEHMPNPLAILRKLHSLMKARRYLLIRIPLASSFAWRAYGVNWFQLDAPRHFFVHTVESMKVLAEQADLRITEVSYDSDEAQFTASEQYLRDIPLNSEKSIFVNPETSIFTPEQILSFAEKAAELNRSSDGDQACFYLYKP